MLSRTLRTVSLFKQFHTSSKVFQVKPWKTLSGVEQKEFITSFVSLYTGKNKRTKNYYKQLAQGMEEHDDIPAVWGLLYNDLVEKKSKNETSAEFDSDFFKIVKH
ncbi:hypothetical protein WICMUC_005633 [Wickerhamomyces mucosus]|uniref:Uncharacterized protein n=1 Tax=Wickerhamomyces mucosus TaxID=1378264 RepID=A0A9P8P7U7_9ASCO|nr:hypothetical protein WICMUC_005633 [Wickerhamomyces mucosus]